MEKIVVKNDQGEELTIEILATFNLKELNKNYVV